MEDKKISIREILEEIDKDMIAFDGEDDAIIGWAFDWHSQEHVVVYSYEKLVENMVVRDGCSVSVAREHIDFNMVGAYLGGHTPIIVNELNQSLATTVKGDVK